MKTKENLKNAEIPKENLKNVTGGNTNRFAIACPSCGGGEWEASNHNAPPGYISLKCMGCGNTYVIPGEII